MFLSGRQRRFGKYFLYHSVKEKENYKTWIRHVKDHNQNVNEDDIYSHVTDIAERSLRLCETAQIVPAFP